MLLLQHASYLSLTPVVDSSFCSPIAEAFVSLATNDEYAKGALALGQSLRETQTTRRLVLMITDQVTGPVGWDTRNTRTNLIELNYNPFKCGILYS